jgi:hypothetical protein
MRTWAYETDSDASIQQRVATIKNAGMTCMMMLGDPENLTWMEHVGSMVGAGCNMYELGNEPDNSTNGTNIGQATQEFIGAVSALRKLNPKAVFAGPAVMYPTSSDGHQGTYPSDIAYFLATTAAARVRADFISYHHYPCFGYTDEHQCIDDTPGLLTAGYDQVLSWEKTYYGATVPTGISEYNFDPGSGTLSAFSGVKWFMAQWTETALATFAADKMAFANEFTTLNYSGYGALDMFSDSSPYGPKAQYWGMVASIEHYGGPDVLNVPGQLP